MATRCARHLSARSPAPPPKNARGGIDGFVVPRLKSSLAFDPSKGGRLGLALGIDNLNVGLLSRPLQELAKALSGRSREVQERPAAGAGVIRPCMMATQPPSCRR